MVGVGALHDQILNLMNLAALEEYLTSCMFTKSSIFNVIEIHNSVIYIIVIFC